MPKIYLYAEILVHIRQLTLHASLQSEKREGTKVDVSTDKRVITVTHDGETQHLYLPTQIKGDASITFPLQKTTDISARVQIEDEHEWKCSVSNEIESPWSATDLDEHTQIRCRSCNTLILSSGKVSQWKALPNENWAELMDFWFCHKPHSDNPAETAAEAKGYASKSKLAIVPGVGMTDLISIALHIEDCTNIKAAETHTRPDSTTLRCSKCTTMLGSTDQNEELIRLQKSCLALNTKGDEFVSYPSTLFTCAQLLSLIESTALKKFIVHSKSTPDGLSSSLLLWMFNPDIYYSCSAFDGNSILSKVVPDADRGSNETDSRDGDARPQVHGVADMKTMPQQATLHNPHGDDQSQIYSEPPASQRLAGELTGYLHFEIPLPRKGSGGQDMKIESIQSGNPTETPLPPSSSDSTTKHDGPVHLDARTTISDQNEHINLVHRAAKVFYQPFPADTNISDFLETHATTHEELFLPNPADLKVLRDILVQTNAMLPGSARSFQDWQVGLLNRYEKKPSGLGVMHENPLARGIQAKDGRVTRWDIGHGAEGLYA